MNCD